VNTCFTKEFVKGQGSASKYLLVVMFFWILSLAGHSTCFATTVALQWDASTDPSLAGYKVYYQADSNAVPFTGTGAAQGAAPVLVQNQTSATVGGLDPSHSYYFAVTAYDTSGIESSYSNVVYVPELVSPATSITFPSNNSSVSGIVSVTVNASDNVGVTKVELYVNGVLMATDSGTPYVFSWDTSSLAAGTYTLSTKAYDAAGNVGQSINAVVTVVNDTTAPVVSLTTPVNVSSVSGTVAIAASASDNVGVSNVEFYLNGAIIYASNVAPYTYNWNSTSVANGSYTLIARAYDNAGNIGQSSSVSVTVNNVVPDTTAPIVTGFTIPATSSSLTVPISSFTATDNVGVTGYLVTNTATAPTSSTTGWTASVPTSVTYSSAGSKTAYAWAKDAAGNVSLGRSASVTITLDTIAPSVSIRVRKDNANPSGVLSVTATATDSVGVNKVEFYVNGVLASTATTAPYVYNWDSNAVANGSYTLIAMAYDAAGNAGQSGKVTISVPNVKFR